MKFKVPRMPLSEFLEQVNRAEVVDDSQIYQLLGVRWYANGCHLHDIVHGHDLKTRTLHKVVAGDLTYNKMWVTKGAFAVVPASLDGLFATSEYPTFAPDPSKLSSAFAKHLVSFEPFQREAAARSSGSTSRARLHPNDFLSIKWAIPPIGIQNRVAEILGSVDDAIAATKAVIEQTKQVKKGLLQELLTKGIGHTKFKQTEIGKIPDSWQVMKIGDLGLVDAGKAKDPHSKAPLRPYLRSANVLDGWIDTADVYEMGFTLEEFERFRLESGDILLNEGQSIGLVGRPAVYQGDPPDVAMQNALLRWRVNPRIIDAEFAYQAVRFLYETGVFSAVATQTTSIAHLGLGRFKGLDLAIPPLDEQQTIATQLRALDTCTIANEELLRRKMKLKLGLLHDLLTGKVRVSA